MLLDNYHFYKRFKKPDLETFDNKSISELRIKYFDGLNIPFHYFNTDNQVKLNDSFSYVLIDGANIEIESYSDVLIIENISKKDISVNLKNYSKKVVLINNPQSSLHNESCFKINNLNESDFFFSNIKNNTFSKSNLSFDLEKNLNLNSLINTQFNQTFDLSVEVLHKTSTQSIIDFIGLNEGKLVSQINSIVPKNVHNCELHQHIKHILLNEKALSYSKPSLMISTPCIASHGNSIGSIPDDWMFFLNSRGINSEHANTIIKNSLKNEFLNNININLLTPILDI